MTPRTTSPLLTEGATPIEELRLIERPSPIEQPSAIAGPSPIEQPSAIAGLPATLAGLRTALGTTHRVARADCDPVASLYARAAECLARTDPEPGSDGGLDGSPGPDQEQAPAPAPAWSPAQAPAPIGALTSACLDLAVAVLGNEEEPLTPGEVLALTNVVTILCTARALIQGGQA